MPEPTPRTPHPRMPLSRAAVTGLAVLAGVGTLGFREAAQRGADLSTPAGVSDSNNVYQTPTQAAAEKVLVDQASAHPAKFEAQQETRARELGRLLKKEVAAKEAGESTPRKERQRIGALLSQSEAASQAQLAANPSKDDATRDTTPRG